MSVNKAQRIVNEINERMGISLVSYQNHELHWLKSQIDDFLDLEIETEELQDPEDCEVDLNELLDEEE